MATPLGTNNNNAWTSSNNNGNFSHVFIYLFSYQNNGGGVGGPF